MARNPRPCCCTHPVNEHVAREGHCIHCAVIMGRWVGCPRYRPAPRKEPLRAPRWRVVADVAEVQALLNSMIDFNALDAAVERYLETRRP